jgi:ribosomal protein S18 acetylase RimI-like enzyme
MTIKLAQTDADILKCRDAILALRPHHADTDLVSLVRNMQTEGYQLAFVEIEGQAAAICGYRYLQFLYCGKHFYIDDLSTLEAYRGRGYGAALLDFVKEEAKSRGFECVTLDSGHQRTTAHRLYLNQGYTIAAHHFMLKIK